MSGWIKMHRVFQKWEWKDSPKHVAVFLDLLLEANFKEKKYRGDIIMPGQLTTSLGKIALRSGVSKGTVVRILDDLESTNEVVRTSNSKRSMITIVNWSLYQGDDTETERKRNADETQTERILVTNKKVKKVKKVKNEKNNNTAGFDFEILYNNYPLKKGKTKGIEKCVKEIKTEQDYLNLKASINNYKNDTIRLNTEKTYIKHFSSFMSIWKDWTVVEVDDSWKNFNHQSAKEFNMEFMREMKKLNQDEYDNAPAFWEIEPA